MFGVFDTFRKEKKTNGLEENRLLQQINSASILNGSDKWCACTQIHFTQAQRYHLKYLTHVFHTISFVRRSVDRPTDSIDITVIQYNIKYGQLVNNKRNGDPDFMFGYYFWTKENKINVNTLMCYDLRLWDDGMCWRSTLCLTRHILRISIIIIIEICKRKCHSFVWLYVARLFTRAHI